MKREAVINFLRNEKIEHLFICEDDEVVFHAKGDLDVVTVFDDELLKATNNEFIHNHPGDFPFSISDVVNTVKFNAKGMTLVTSRYFYVIQRSLGGWNIDIEHLEKDFMLYDDWANDEIDKLVLKNLMNAEYAHQEKNHYIWLLIFDKYGINYFRKSSPNGI